MDRCSEHLQVCCFALWHFENAAGMWDHSRMYKMCKLKYCTFMGVKKPVCVCTYVSFVIGITPFLFLDKSWHCCPGQWERMPAYAVLCI